MLAVDREEAQSLVADPFLSVLQMHQQGFRSVIGKAIS